MRGDVRRGPGGLTYLAPDRLAVEKQKVVKGRTGLVSGLLAPVRGATTAAPSADGQSRTVRPSWALTVAASASLSASTPSITLGDTSPSATTASMKAPSSLR